jgi:hypothetical protein
VTEEDPDYIELRRDDCRVSLFVRNNSHGRDFSPVGVMPEKLTEPFAWRSRKLVFVNSMSDLFQAGSPDCDPAGTDNSKAQLIMRTMFIATPPESQESLP